MSVKRIGKYPFVRMTKKELKEYLETHPNAKHTKARVSSTTYCDICGKKIDTKGFYQDAHISYVGTGHKFESYDICPSDECVRKVIELFADLCTNQTGDDRPDSLHFWRHNDPQKETVRCKKMYGAGST